MKVKELVVKLKKLSDQDREIVVASDEEWNSLMTGLDIGVYEDKSCKNGKNAYVIFGFSGTEMQEAYEEVGTYGLEGIDINK